MRRLLVLYALAGACYSPQVSPGAPCSADGTCPAGLDCIGGHCLLPGTNLDDAGPSDDAPVPLDGPIDAAMIATPDAPPDAFVDTTLVAHWKLDDDPANGALDSSGRGHTATCQGTCPTLVTAKVGSGYRFNGGQALTVPDSLDFRASFTIAGWALADQIGPQMAMMSKPVGTGTGNSWQLELRDTGKMSFTGGSAHYLDEAGTTSAAVWRHVAGTWDGTTKRLYINGALVSSVASQITYDTHAIYLGADENNGSTALQWDGVLDDLRIYSRVLTASEIAALAQ